jgi:hypothetical protein
MRGPSSVQARVAAVGAAVLAAVGAAACATALLAACAASRASFDGAVYRDGPVAFQLPSPPAGWRRVDVTDGSLAFRDDAHEGSVLVNARCTRPDDDTPLVALTNHLLIGATERDFTAQATEPLDGREALHSRVRAKWDGVPTELVVFVLKKDGCIYDLVYTAPAGKADAGAAEFVRFARGFRTLPGSGVVKP